jgi:hypothetical protein
MKHHYATFFFVLMFALITYTATAQNAKQPPHTIKGLSVYPNPAAASTSTISITSTLNSPKSISVYDVLGKLIIGNLTVRERLDIASLKSGVYILEITERGVSESRKLIIR